MGIMAGADDAGSGVIKVLDDIISNANITKRSTAEMFDQGSRMMDEVGTGSWKKIQQLAEDSGNDIFTKIDDGIVGVNGTDLKIKHGHLDVADVDDTTIKNLHKVKAEAKSEFNKIVGGDTSPNVIGQMNGGARTQQQVSQSEIYGTPAQDPIGSAEDLKTAQKQDYEYQGARLSEEGKKQLNKVDNKGWLKTSIDGAGDFLGGNSTYSEAGSTIKSAWNNDDLTTSQTIGAAVDAFSGLTPGRKAGMYAAGAVGTRIIRGGGTLHNPEGVNDVAGVPFL